MKEGLKDDSHLDEMRLLRYQSAASAGAECQRRENEYPPCVLCCMLLQHDALGSVGSDAGWTMESGETDFRFVWREQRSQLMAGCRLGSQAHIQAAQAP